MTIARISKISTFSSRRSESTPPLSTDIQRFSSSRMRCIRLPELNVDLRASLRAAPRSTGIICFKGGNRKR